MKKNKFYALLKGTTQAIVKKNERVYDKKTKKYFNRVVDTKVSQPKDLVVPLSDARNRREAHLEALAIANKYGLKLEGVHAFKN